jgi:hypothetical protein
VLVTQAFTHTTCSALATHRADPGHKPSFALQFPKFRHANPWQAFYFDADGLLQ